MNAEQRVRMAIGDLVIQLQAALARIAELEGQVNPVPKDEPEGAEASKGNGSEQLAERL